MSESGNDRIFGALFALIEWAFEVNLTARDKAAIEGEVLNGWENGDRSDQELVGYLLQLQKMIWQVGPTKREGLRDQARAIFKRGFAKTEANDRGRILSTLHHILEGASPGVTGVAGAAPTVPPVPHLNVPATFPPTAVVVSSAPNPLFAGAPQPPPTAAVAPLPLDVGRVNDFERKKREALREQQRIGMESALAAIEHETIMGIIKNMR